MFAFEGVTLNRQNAAFRHSCRIGDFETAAGEDIRFPGDAAHQCLRGGVEGPDEFDQGFEPREAFAALHLTHMGPMDRSPERELFLRQAGLSSKFDEICGESVREVHSREFSHNPSVQSTVVTHQRNLLSKRYSGLTTTWVR